MASRPHEVVKLGRLDVLLPAPDEPPERALVGREDIVRRCQAAWLDMPGAPRLHFRLTGPPGTGKNEIVYHLARNVLRQPLHIMQGHEELTPEDLVCTARVGDDRLVQYVGSPLLAAMIRGRICFFDEIGKVPERSLSPLADALDDRRTIKSGLVGFTVEAHPDFRFCAAINDADAMVSDLPGYIDERLRPEFRVGYPPHEEIIEIVKQRVSGEHAVLLERFRLWLSRQKEELSPRSCLSLVSLAIRLAAVDPDKGKQLPRARADELICEAALDVHRPTNSRTRAR